MENFITRFFGASVITFGYVVSYLNATISNIPVLNRQIIKVSLVKTMLIFIIALCSSYNSATLPANITTTVNSKSLTFSGTSMHLINKIIFPGDIEVSSAAFTSQTANAVEVALPAGIPEGLGAAKVVYSGGEIITDNLYYGSLEEVADTNYVFFDFNGNGKDVFTYGSEIEDMTSSTETSHDDTFFFDANYSFPGSWSWGAGYLFGKSDSDGNPLIFETIDPIEDVVKFDVYIKDGLSEGLIKIGLGGYYYVWDITSIAPSEGLKTAGWITKTCPISEFIQDGTGNVLTDLEEARSGYSMVWASDAAVDMNISIDNLRFASSATLPTNITTTVNSKSLTFSGTSMHLINKIIFPGDIEVSSAAFTSQTANAVEVALPAGIPEGLGAAKVVYSGGEIITDNLYYGSLEEVADTNYVFFDFNGNGKDVFTYGSEIEDMTSSTETSHDDTFFFDANYSFPGSWSWGAGYLFGKSDSDGNPLIFETIDPIEDVVKFDVYIKDGLSEGLIKIGLGGYYYVWDITSIAPSEGLKTAGWITKTCPISEFIQDGTGNVLTDLEEARSGYSMVWASDAAVDMNISIDNLRFASSGTLPTNITTTVNSKSLTFSGTSMHLINKIIFPGDIEVSSAAFTSQTANAVEVALPAGIPEGLGAAKVVYSGGEIITDNLYYGSLEEVADTNYVFFDFNGNGKDVFTYGSEIEDMTSSTETSHDDTFFFDANYSFPGSWSWGAGYLFGKSDSDGNPLIFETIDPIEDVVKFDVYIKDGLSEGLIKIGLGGYYYVWDITSIAPSEGLKTAGWITKTCPISEFIQDGTGNVLTDLEEARSGYSMVWASDAAVDMNISIDNLRFASSGTLPTNITTTVNSKSLTFSGTSMHLINKIIFPGDIEVSSAAFTSQTANAVEVALPAGIPEGLGAAKVVYSGGEIITDNLYYGSLEEVADTNYVFFDFNGNGKDVFTYGSEIEDMTSSTETSHDDTFFFDANYSFPGSWSWGAGYLFGKSDSDGNPLIFETIDPIEDVVKFDVYIKDGLSEGLIKIGLGGYYYVWDITSIAPSEGLKTAGWITKTCPISEFIQDGTGNVLTDLEEARSGYSMVWASDAAVAINISIDNLRFASSSGSLSINNLFLNNVVLYPNPFSNTITINASKQVDKVVKIEIFSTNGVLVNSIVADNDITTLDTSNLAKGMYFIRLSSDNGNHNVKKMIKN